MIRDAYNDYKIALLKLIKNKSLKMLEGMINDDKNIEYREMLKRDDIIKNKWVNDIFKMGIWGKVTNENEYTMVV